MIKTTWHEIDTWLISNAPEIANSLAGPADELAIQEREQVLKETLPEDFKEPLRIHDGQTVYSHSFVNLYCLLSTERILDEFNVWKGLLVWVVGLPPMQ
ncbi:MAG: SMI1/KNR4 family protein [Candidatus Obscuribacterales bacterium]